MRVGSTWGHNFTWARRTGLKIVVDASRQPKLQCQGRHVYVRVGGKQCDLRMGFYAWLITSTIAFKS